MFGKVVYIQKRKRTCKVNIFFARQFFIANFIICCTICTRVKSIDCLVKVLKFC